MDPVACPVFVTGVSRSGTTLVRQILNASDDLWVAPETHYFDDLRPRLHSGGSRRLDPADVARCERYFFALSHRPYGQTGAPAEATVDREELRAEAAALGWTGDAWFEAFCRVRAHRNGRARWGEKTPRHVFRIDDILAFRPHAQVICLVRDPRGVAASYRDWKRGRRQASGQGAAAADNARAARSYNVVLNALIWRSAAAATLAALGRHGPDRVHVLQYEQLLARPEQTLRELCDWLGLAYRERMLQVRIVHSSYGTQGSGISREPLERWREKLAPSEIRTIERHCGRLMDAHGYALENPAAPIHRQALTYASVPFAVVRAGYANRRRLGKPTEYVRKRLAGGAGRPARSA
jgi:hypothetical protein